MNLLVDSPWTERIGWALLHSLWQGALIWSIAALLLTAGRNLSAARRHFAGWLAITLLALCPLVTVTWLACKAVPQKAETARAVPSSVAAFSSSREAERKQPASVSSSVSAQKVVEEYDRAANPPRSVTLRSFFPFLVIGWLIGVALLTLRLALGWWWLSRLRHRSIPVADSWMETFANLRRRFSLPAALVRSVSHLGIPMVVGWLRPVIYLPASLLSGQSAAEVEAVFLHEMAHLKRKDLLLQLWVTIVETLLFYHPAVHALGRATRETAEEACDDLVLQWTSDGRTYARALVTLEEARAERLALAASGGRLHHRLRRILGMPQEASRPGLGLRFGFTACVGVALYLFLGSVAVPQLAKALTPAERVALLEKRQKDAHAGSPQAKEEKLIAIGQVHLPPGAQPAASYSLHTFSHGSNYSSGDTAETITDVRAEGKGDQMMVGIVMKGFAPAETLTSVRDPKTDRASFYVTLEKGFPANIQVINEKGDPIPNAQLIPTVIFPSGDSIYYNNAPLITTAAGEASPGNVLTSSRIDCEVRAHGYRWSNFFSLSFVPDRPTVLKVARAKPVQGVVVDAGTKKPLMGCRAYCRVRDTLKRTLNTYHYVGRPDSMPEISAMPSDARGNLRLDVCDPEDKYDVLLSAPGYERTTLKMSPGTATFSAELKRAFTLSGVIRDPDHLLKPHNGKISCFLQCARPDSTSRGIELEWVSLPLDPKGMPFHFDQAPAGDFTLSCGPGKPWRIKIKQDLQKMEWRVTRDGLMSLNGPAVSPEPAEVPAPTRQVRIHFLLPKGAPPLTGEFHVSAGYKSWEQAVSDNRAVFDVTPPVEMDYRAPGLVGWTFNERSVKIEKGGNPIDIEQEVIPAGAISGAYHDAPDYGEKVYARMLVSEHAKMPNGDPWRNVESLRQFGGNRYFVSPIPLHGSYRVVTWSGAAFAETPLLTLDDAHPLVERDVTFGKGTDVSGQVLQPNGQPFAESVVEFRYLVDGHDVFWPRRTDLEGRLDLRGVNFGLSGTYLLTVPASRGVAPVSMPLTKGMQGFKLQRVVGLPLEVSVVDEADQPVREVRLFAFPEADQPGFSTALDRVTADAPSNPEGRVHFSTLKKGRYRIGAEGEYALVTEGLLALHASVADMSVFHDKPLRLRVKKREQKK
jgi:beta-lactamase regulating signal transducer with metallopeptidase domain